MFTFIPPRVTFCSATTLQVPTTHSEEINLQAKKRKLDCYPSGTENDKRGWNGRKLFFAGHKQSVPSVCLSVSLAGNRPPNVYKGSVLSGEESYQALSVQFRISAGTRDPSGWNSKGKKDGWPSIHQTLWHTLPLPGQGVDCDGLWGTYEGQIPRLSVFWYRLVWTRGRKIIKFQRV